MGNAHTQKDIWKMLIPSIMTAFITQLFTSPKLSLSYYPMKSHFGDPITIPHNC